jgi:hypothetical protein
MKNSEIPIPPLKPFKVGTEELDIDGLLKRDYDDVREAAQILPAAMSYLGWQRAYYSEQRYIAEVAIKEVKARLTMKYKAEGLDADGYVGVKPTEGAIEAAVLVHPDVLAAHRQYAKWVRIVDNLYGQIDAFKFKIELVRSGEATTRQAVAHDLPSDEELENHQRKHQTGD